MTEGAPGSTVPRRQLGRYLRRLREESRTTVRQAAEALEWSTPKIWRIEKGDASMRSLDVEQMCRAYDADADTTKALMALAKETKAKGWWHAYGDVIPDSLDLYIGLEAAASEFRWYEAELVPGIFQTEAYATAIVAADEENTGAEVARRVEVRLSRQALLTRARPPQHTVVLNEAILRRPVGGPSVMAEQLDRLAEVSELPSVTLRVMPYGVGTHLGIMSGPFVVLDFPPARNGDGPSEPSTVYVDGWTGALYLDKPRELDRYAQAFDDLTKRSLDEGASRDLIREAARRMRT